MNFTNEREACTCFLLHFYIPTPVDFPNTSTSQVIRVTPRSQNHLHTFTLQKLSCSFSLLSKNLSLIRVSFQHHQWLPSWAFLNPISTSKGFITETLNVGAWILGELPVPSFSPIYGSKIQERNKHTVVDNSKMAPWSPAPGVQASV